MEIFNWYMVGEIFHDHLWHWYLVSLLLTLSIWGAFIVRTKWKGSFWFMFFLVYCNYYSWQSVHIILECNVCYRKRYILLLCSCRENQFGIKGSAKKDIQNSGSVTKQRSTCLNNNYCCIQIHLLLFNLQQFLHTYCISCNFVAFHWGCKCSVHYPNFTRWMNWFHWLCTWSWGTKQMGKYFKSW